MSDKSNYQKTVVLTDRTYQALLRVARAAGELASIEWVRQNEDKIFFAAEAVVDAHNALPEGLLDAEHTR